MARKRITIIGGGPAGLIAADVLASSCDVHLYEKGKSVGRKFLVAGQGGFNLTNELDGDALKVMYSPSGFLDDALDAFGSTVMRAWLRSFGIETFVGTSGRVFPVKGIKPIDVLNALRGRLTERGVHFHLEHTFVGFAGATNRATGRAGAIIDQGNEREVVEAEAMLFALGGVSWPVTGSTGEWLSHIQGLGVATAPFRPSNCGVEVPWPEAFVKAHVGKPLKNIRLSAGERSVSGEATITAHGLEGNAVYPVVPAVRDALYQSTDVELRIDLKPNNTREQLLDKIAGKEPKNYAEALNLDRAAFALLKAFTPKDRFLSPFALVGDIKDLCVPVSGLRPIEEAISTVGGISIADLSPDFSLKRYPNIFTLGEMVDWDAPTGGFLLQGCFAMGHHAARSILRR